MEEVYVSVTALTKYIKYKFDHDINLSDVLLQGEISNFKHNSRGHFYFTLKDENAAISATMFASYASKVKFEPSDGMKVFVKGTVTVYEPSGTYQINVREMKSDGIGDLYVAFEKLKEQLAKEGYFNPEHKKPLPRFPKHIGVITSPTGAAIKDIINTISRRYPLCDVILYPAIVQGDDAKNDVVKQIEKANNDNICDCLIVGRGGGSIEDLWAFNERIVCEAIYNSKIPVISAVGHEIDFTIADFVADKRAATPTAAAEIATPLVSNLIENVNYYVDRMTKIIKYQFNEKKMVLASLDKRLENDNPISLVEHKYDLLKNYYDKLNILIKHKFDDYKYRFNLDKSKLESLNPLMIMEKGYSISEVDGKVIVDVNMVKPSDTLKTKVKNGEIISIVKEVRTNGK